MPPPTIEASIEFSGSRRASTSVPPIILRPDTQLRTRAGEQVYGTVFYPTAANAGSAAPLEIAPGTEMQGIDITLVNTWALAGARHRGGHGQSTSGPGFGLDRSTGRDYVFTPRRSRGSHSETNGSFELHEVTTGSYFLFANINGRTPRLAGRSVLDVGTTNVEGVVVTVRPPSEVAAKITIEGQTEDVPKSMGLYLQPRDPGMFGTPASANGNEGPIRMHVTQDVYEVNAVGSSGNQYLKSVKFGDVEVTDMTLDFSQGVPSGEINILVSPAGAQSGYGPCETTRTSPLPMRRSCWFPILPSEWSAGCTSPS